MGLPSQLTLALVCFLACTSTVVRGYDNRTLREIIITVNDTTHRKDSCLKLTIPDVFANAKKPSEKITFCQASSVLWKMYKQSICPLKGLKRLSKNLISMAEMKLHNCPVTQESSCTLENFLERLKAIMQEKLRYGS